jgi:hypothetical protein
VPKPATPWIVAFAVGLSFGYIAWGDHARRTEAHFVEELGAVLGDVREQNRLMQDILAERERKTYASLAVCEKAQVKLQGKLETCLFGKADPHAADTEEQLDPDNPRSGVSPLVETFSYPVQVPGGQPPPDPDAPKAPAPKVLQAQ